MTKMLRNVGKWCAFYLFLMTGCVSTPPCAPLGGGEHAVIVDIGDNNCGLQPHQPTVYTTDFSGPSHDAIASQFIDSDGLTCSADINLTAGETQYVGWASVVDSRLVFTGTAIARDCTMQLTLTYVPKE